MISDRLLESFATGIATGATMIAESSSVEINAASVRRSPNACLSFENSGQVVKHKIAAHSAAEIKGRRIRRQPNTSNETPATAIHLSTPARVSSPSFAWLLSVLIARP
jgi:hypothetical protein